VARRAFVLLAISSGKSAAWSSSPHRGSRGTSDGSTDAQDGVSGIGTVVVERALDIQTMSDLGIAPSIVVGAGAGTARNEVGATG
jgi:hypothetical protein